MRNLILFVCTIILIGACKKKKDDPNPPGTLNQWDGRSRIEGTMVDHKDPAFVWAGNTYEDRLHTSGTNTDSLVSKDFNLATNKYFTDWNPVSVCCSIITNIPLIYRGDYKHNIPDNYFDDEQLIK